MKSNTLAGLFADLGIEISRNRPRVSNDNPFSEALFKTAKYIPSYPAYFNDIVQARAWAATARQAFIDGYVEASGTDLSRYRDLLAAFELDKAVYEAIYETRNRPDWAPIPLRAIEQLLAAGPLQATAPVAD